MPLNLVLIPQRQSANGVALSWSAMDGVAACQIFVGERRLSPEELEAAQLLDGTDECIVVKVGAEVHSVVDDVTTQGEARYYGVAMLFDDGAMKAARFKAVPDGGTAESFQLSAVRARKSAAPVARAAAPRPGSAPATGNTGSYRVAPATAPATGHAGASFVAPPLEPRQFPSTLPVAATRPGEPPPPPPPPSSFPLEERLEVRMKGATQTWDGLRIYWEREPRAAAYEVIASDHQVFGDELADALAGKADFTTAVALPASATAVIDNVTARESRGWYAVLVRQRDGSRAVHPFQVGDAATSGRTVAPFLNPNRTGELRGEVEDLIAQAQEQWSRWKSEQDEGARREARRLVGDALLIWPNDPAAKKLSDEMG